MTERMESLRRRRELLVLRAELQRSEMSSIGGQLHARLWPVDLGIAVARALRRRPLLAAGAVMLAAGRRNRLMFWGTRMLTLWELIEVVRKQLPRRGA